MSGIVDSDGSELTRGEIDPNAPEAYLSVYRRYRETVRSELESAGLEPIAAELEIGGVFLELMSNLGELAPDASLGPRLRELARAAAKRLPPAAPEPSDSPPLRGTSHSRPLGRLGKDGYYGSGH